MARYGRRIPRYQPREGLPEWKLPLNFADIVRPIAYDLLVSDFDRAELELICRRYMYWRIHELKVTEVRLAVPAWNAFKAKLDGFIEVGFGSAASQIDAGRYFEDVFFEELAATQIPLEEAAAIDASLVDHEPEPVEPEPPANNAGTIEGGWLRKNIRYTISQLSNSWPHLPTRLPLSKRR